MSAVRRDGAPPPTEARGFRFPPFLKRRCENGLTIYAARVPRVPLATLELVFPAGGHWDPPGLPGLATLTASLIDEGTAGSSSLEIARRAEDLGGYLASYAEWDYGAVEVGLLASELSAAFDLLTEVATAPTFPEREIERLKKLRTTELERRRFEPATLADEQLARALYGGTPYAESPLGTIESVARIGRDEALDFFARHYPLGSATMIAVGDVDPEGFADEIEERLGRAATPAAPPAAEIVPAVRPGVSIQVIDRPDAAQTELRLGHAAVGRRHPDYVPLLLLNTLLGGKFTSRINLNLRERHGFTYGATTRLGGRLGPGPFSVAAAVATESTGAAVREVLFELERIRTEEVSEDEMEETRRYITGVFPYSSQTLGDVAKRLEVLSIYDLPDDYYDRYLERIGSVDRPELLALAHRHIRPEEIAIVAVGPAEKIAGQLSPYGPVEIVPSA